MKSPNNKRDRFLIKLLKFKKRTWWIDKYLNKEKSKDYKKIIKDFHLYGFMTNSKPCSCWACKRPRYDRKKDNSDRGHTW